ncbi:DNA alkylation repair protein [Aureispira anguillae]|uniref:DNA alkylation repair protein n=1 Tax=Aureispira anguillae TaxID=2864201 RepID=A0A915YH68_9BACT|nr:DNA alkylation repair protein [Aureispira anguillae]BDS12873.1 DNA alkylation repair protein [Aureispira anguillae]
MKPEKKFEFSAVLNPEVVAQIGQSIKKVWKPFERERFESKVSPKLASLAFKERANLIAQELHEFLPTDFAEGGQILLDAFGDELGSSETAKDNVFLYMPYGVYVSWYGLEEKDFELATQFLYEMTKRFSAEFAIRPFLEKYPSRMLKKMEQWVKDDNQHVRRLVSEGTRPRLPWAPRVTVYDDNYSVIIALLATLRNDPELYVRRSVANHLNDLTKDRKELVIQTLEKWNKKTTAQIEWITKHALRTLVKAGNSNALKLLGFSDSPQVEIGNFKVHQNELKLGEKLEFSFEINSKTSELQPLIVDYIIYFKKANGMQSPKVFKLKILDLAGNKSIKIQKKQLFKHFSTRILYEGEHAVELQINGQSYGRKAFELVFD